MKSRKNHLNKDNIMSLQALSSTSTDFLPSMRFHARLGVFSRVDRALNAEGKWESSLTDINDVLASEGALVDLTNIKLGWLKFDGGVDIQVQHHSLPAIPQPSNNHKDGLMLEIWLPKTVSDGSPLREFSHTAAGVKNAVNDLHTAAGAGRRKY